MLNSCLDILFTKEGTLSAAVALALSKAVGTAKDELIAEPQPEKFTRELRDPVYLALKLTQSQINAIEEMIAEAPARIPGKGALDNLITLIPSAKNGGRRWLESHTVERLYFYSVERDPTVIGYVTQVRCRGVTREVKKGKHVSSPTLDFLVFYEDRISLVECKTVETLEKLSLKKSEWSCNDGTWTNTPYKEFAARLGLELEIYAVDRLFSIELQNAELITYELNSVDSQANAILRANASRLLRDRPLTIEQLSSLIPGFTVRTAAKMLAERSVFGLERIISLADTDTFLLFSAEVHRDVIDAELWPLRLDETAELKISDQLLLASEKHVKFAKKRWAKLQAIGRGEELITRKMDELSRIVLASVEKGISPIEACLPRYPNSGNRSRRLTGEQIAAIEQIVIRWSKGEFSDRTDAWFELEKICKNKEIPTPHQTTLNLEIRKTDKTRRTLIVDGIRQYQKDKDRTDGSKCSLPSIAFGHTLIIDSSNFDQRTAKNLLTQFPSSVPRFYAGIDGSTGYPMAHALLFGPARTDGLAILMREFVSRHGFLPQCIQLDRGSENTGKWIKDFADHYDIELRWVPTGGSRYNGQAENVIGRVNHAVAHKAPGSTLPDQKGRSTDGRLKSRKTASKGFEYIVQKFEDYFYGELANTRDKENLSPTDRKEYIIELVGAGGRNCEFNDAFRVLTSIKIDIPKSIHAARGIRLVEGAYSGSALNNALRKNHITELRKDCINPAILYAKAGGLWYRAFRRDCVPLLDRSGAACLYRLLNEPQWRSDRTAHNLDQKRNSYEKRVAEMQEAMPGKEHLTSAVPETESQVESHVKKKPEFEYPIVDWDTVGSYCAA